MPFEGREQVEGSASIGQFNSGFDYYKRIQMGEVAESRALYMNPLRHGLFNALISSGRQSIDFNKRIQFIQHIGVKTWTSTGEDRKSTRLNSSHVAISYAVFCLKKK